MRIALALLLSLSAHAKDEACEIKGKNRQLASLMKPAKSEGNSFLIYWLNLTKPKVEASATACEDCNGATTTTPIYSPHIKRECLVASMRRQDNIAGNRTACSSNSWGKAIRGNQCLTSQMIDYVHFTFNAAMGCMAATGTNIDPRVFFKKFNNESAFDFSLSGNNGLGIGQITSIAGRELSCVKKNRKSICYDGHSQITRVRNSTAKACEPFQSVLKKELDFSDSKRLQACQMVSPGEGIARNLIYSMALFLHYRDSFGISVSIKGQKYGINSVSYVLAKKGYNMNDPKVQEARDYLALIAFSAGGPAQAESLMRQFANKKNSAAKLLQLVRANSNYLKNTDRKMGEVLRSLGRGKSKSPDLSADLCLELARDSRGA